MKPNITMIGMLSSGKNTIGVLLIKRLGLSFVGANIAIQEKEGRPLREIIAQEGMDRFLKVEERINVRLDVALSVIAPGGSVIYGEEATEHLKEISEMVYLRTSYKEMENCIGNMVDRGVALRPGFTLRNLYNERVPYYEKYTDAAIGGGDKTSGETADVLRNIIEGMMDHSMIKCIVEGQKKVLEEEDHKIEAYEAEIAAFKEELALFRAAETGGCGSWRLRKLRRWKLSAAKIETVETVDEGAIQRLGHGWKKTRSDLWTIRLSKSSE